jgi:hypothetical protein
MENNMKKKAISIALIAIASIGLNAPLWAEPASSNSESSQLVLSPGDSKSSTAMDLNQSEDETVQGQTATESGIANINPGDYVDKKVISAKGETIGTIDKLVVKNDGQGAYAVVGVGGFYGIGEKDAAIPIRELSSQGVNWSLSDGITEESLKSSMAYEKTDFSAFEMRQPLSTPHPEMTDGNTPTVVTEPMQERIDVQGGQSGN